jgi:hypothetical protein
MEYKKEKLVTEGFPTERAKYRSPYVCTCGFTSYLESSMRHHMKEVHNLEDFEIISETEEKGVK